MSRGLKISLITFLSLITILLIVFFVALLNNSVRFDFNKNYKDVVLDKIYENNIDKVTIKSNGANINIKTSSDDKIRVVIKGIAEKTTVSESNNELIITSNVKKCNFLCVNHKIAKIDVYLPSDYNKKIVIDSKMGDIKVGNFGKASLNVDLNFGDINVNNINKITAKNDFGDIEIGKVNYYLNIKEECGDIKIDVADLKKSSKIKNSLGDIEINKINDIYIDAKTSLGDTEIASNNRHSDIILTIKNSCGDIEVK